MTTLVSSYFPVEAPHRMPGPQPKLGHPSAGRTVLEVDERYAEYVAGKRSSAPARLSEVAADEEQVRAWLAETLRREHPRLRAEGTLDELVAGIQEDLVVMRRPDGAEAADARAVSLHVALPSGWCPACACGRTFVDIHAPVPGLHAFDQPHRRKLARALFAEPPGTPRVRFVWTVTPDARLDRRRCVAGLHASAAPSSWAGATSAWLRVERQVIVPLDARLCVFLIRIHQRDVRTLTPEQREILRASVRDMEEPLAAYKGLAADRARIEALLIGV